MFTVRLSTKGQIVIPKAIREHLNLCEGDMFTMEAKGEMLILQRNNKGNWRRWKGVLKGTSALQDHEQEHDEEVKSEEGS